MAISENPGQDLLAQMAEIAGKKTKLTLELKPATDASVGWIGTGIHPLQFLETSHQRAAMASARKVTVKGNQSAADDQQAAQEAQISKYFLSTSQEPAPLIIGDTEPVDKSALGVLKAGKKTLKAIIKPLVFTAMGEDDTGLMSITIEPHIIPSDNKAVAKITVKVLDDKKKAIMDGEEISIYLLIFNEQDQPVEDKAVPPETKTGLVDPQSKERKEDLIVETKGGKAEATLAVGDLPGLDPASLTIEVEAMYRGKIASARIQVEKKDYKDDLLEDLQKKTRELFDKLKDVHDGLLKIDIDAAVHTPVLKKIEDLRKDCQEKIDGLSQIDTRKKLKAQCSMEMKSLIDELEKVAVGLAQVQMLFGIDAFYLFRLLVPFNIVSGKKESKKNKRDASGDLTDLLNNGDDMQWLRDWLIDKMISLTDALKEAVGDKAFFYLKGGRALYYLLGDESKAKNDWDTAIVIDPCLDTEKWYATLSKVHNAVLEELRKAKLEFFVLLHKNQKAVEERLKAADKDLKPAEDRIAEYVEEVGNACKAELIDIGIPRRDTIEAIEQWHHYHEPKNRIRDKTTTKNIWIPGYLYFVDEYVVMVREALAGVSPAPHKAHKRIDRLYQVVNMKSGKLDNTIEELQKTIKGDGRPFEKSIGLTEKSAWEERMATVLLSQFMSAYDLKFEPGLAEVFDKTFKDESGKLPALNLPAEVEKGLEEKDKKTREPKYPHHEKLKGVLQWVGLADKLSGWRPDESTMFEKHFQDRAAFFGFGHDEETWRGEKWHDTNVKVEKAPPDEKARRGVLGKFIKAIYTYYATVFGGEAVEIQLAVSGSFAAYLHADYARLDKELRALMDPVKTIEMKVFLYQRSEDRVAAANTAIKLVILPAIENFVKRQTEAKFKYKHNEQDGSVNIWWPQEETMGDLDAYKPLIVRITVENGYWPQLGFVLGFPLLSLRDLIREYDHRAALTEEWGRKQKLKATSLILKELLTRYDYLERYDPKTFHDPLVFAKEKEKKEEASPPPALTVSIDKDTIEADEKSTATVTVQVLDGKTGEPLKKSVTLVLKLSGYEPGKDEPVRFLGVTPTGLGDSLEEELWVKTTNDGKATATLKAGNRPLTVKVEASYKMKNVGGLALMDLASIQVIRKGYKNVLLPLAKVEPPTLDLKAEEASISITPIELDSKIEVNKYFLRVRREKDAYGNIGAVIYEREYAGLPKPTMSWDGSVNADWRSTKRAMKRDAPLLIEVEATVKGDMSSYGTKNTRVKVDLIEQ